MGILETYRKELIPTSTDDLSDVFMGHNTWANAQGMIRIYKFYEFGHL
jgi:hypothetical protein